MKTIDPLFAYLSILAVIQPARIQDIEQYSESVLGKEIASWLEEREKLRDAHEDARRAGLVSAIRRGVYFMTPRGKHIVRRAGLEHSIDNRRLFLMKEQRRRYK
jgi:Mn-dependent DtxR family transcriptional regulator